MRWPFVSRRERLRREAADWVARLNGPQGDRDRADFERWYASSPDQARAYDRLAGLFSAAGKLSRADRASPSVAASRPPSRARPLRYVFGAALACATLLAFVLLSARTISPPAEAGEQFAAFSVDDIESRRLVLADGSQVLLSAGSRLEVSIGASERRLRLLRGEGRFAVAHEGRPFIVEANGAEVVARGTLFVVRVAADRTTVSLIEGRVDVSYPGGGGEPNRRRVTRLEAGERLMVAAAAVAEAAPAAGARPPTGARTSAPAMLQFDDLPLAEAVEQVSRYGRPPVRLGDPGLGALRVTGAFRAGDTSGFAESVAAAFGLEVDRDRDGSLRLRQRTQAAAPNEIFGG
ncbi:MAG TPA: FecR domain-containing protein [Allosphingosinicella sp.]|jgi:transmembrane sensor